MASDSNIDTNIIFGSKNATLPDCSMQKYLYKQLQNHNDNTILYVSNFKLHFAFKTLVFSKLNALFYCRLTFNVIYR